MADEQITSNTANIPFVNLAEQGSDPTTPASGRAVLYVKGGTLYVRLDDGTVVPVGGAVALAEGQLAIGDGSDVLSALSLGTEGQLVTADASGHATWADAPEGGGGGGSGNVILTPLQRDSDSGGTLAVNVNVSSWFGITCWSSPAAQGNSVTWKADLPAGTYSVRLLFHKGPDVGIHDLSIGGTQVGTADGYNSGYLLNQIALWTGFTLASGGVKDVVLAVPTKNPSSSAYSYYFTAIAIWRTA